jgi:hypothetical protein
MGQEFSSIWIHAKPYLWGLAFIVVLSAVFAMLSLGRAKIVDGWRVLRPTPLLYGMGALSIPMSLMFLVFGVMGLIAGHVWPGDAHPRLVAAGMLVFGAMLPYCAVTTFFVRVRFNDQGVQKSWFGRPRFTPWTDVRRLERSFSRGRSWSPRPGGA